MDYHEMIYKLCVEVIEAGKKLVEHGRDYRFTRADPSTYPYTLHTDETGKRHYIRKDGKPKWASREYIADANMKRCRSRRPTGAASASTSSGA